MLGLNLFPSIPPTTNQHTLRIQRISTRIFIILLVLSLTVLLLYTSTVRVTRTVTVQAPNLDQYSSLYRLHSQTLACPCTKIAINYKAFLRINHTAHQICSSVYISDQWITYVSSCLTGLIWLDDFRYTSPHTFQTLQIVCQLAKKSISARLEEFYSNNYVSAVATPSAQFRLQLGTLIEQFISSTTNNFLLSLELIRDTTQANVLLSALMTNYYLSLNHDTGSIDVYPIVYTP